MFWTRYQLKAFFCVQCSSHSILQNIKQKKWCNLISWIYTEKSLPRLCKIVTLYPFIYKSEFLVWNLCFLATYPTNVFAESENAKCTFFTMVCLLFLQGEIEEKFVWVSLYFWWLGQSPIKRYDPPYCCFSRFIDSSLPPPCGYDFLRGIVPSSVTAYTTEWWHQKGQFLVGPAHRLFSL